MIPARTASRVEIKRQLLSGADDPAGARRDPAGEGVEELRLAVAFGTGDPDDLAAVQREADRAERLPLQGIDDEHFVGLGRRRNRRRERRLERAADDPLDQLRFRGGRGVVGSLMPPVTKHGDPVGDLEHFRQPMADVDHTDAATLARQHGSVEGLDLLWAEGGGGLVEEQHLGFGHERLGHLEQLALGHRERAHRGVREQLEVEVEVGEDLARPLLPVPVARASLPGGVVEVVLHRLGVDRRAVLVGHRQAELARQRR